MVNDIIYRFLQHPRRQWIIGGVTALFTVIFVLPAWDSHSASKATLADSEFELEEILRSVANLEPMRLRAQQVTTGTTACRMMDARAAEEFREELVRLAFKLECRTRRVALSDPQMRPWGKEDDPFNSVSPAQSDKSKYQLETRKLELSVGGSLTKLSKLLSHLNGLNEFAVPTNMTLQREGQNEELRLDVTVLLFNLLPVND